MPGLTQLDRRVIVRRMACRNGEEIFSIVPQNRLGKVVGFHADAAYSSGLTGQIQLQLLDYFATIDTGTTETSGSVVRFQTTINAGDVGDIPLPEPIQFFGSIRVGSNFSGPIVSLSMAYL